MKRSYCVCSSGRTETYKWTFVNPNAFKKQFVNSYLGGTVEEGEANSRVINFELVDAVNVGDRKLGTEDAIRASLERGANERVDPDEFQLDVLSVERHPLVFLQFLDLNLVHL